MPAKASASEKVPTRIVMRRMLILSRWMKKSSSEQPTQQINSERSRCWSMKRMKARPASTVLSPLKRAK